MDLNALFAEKADSLPSFELINLEIDCRPKFMTGYIPVPHGPKKALLIGNDGQNQARQAYLFDAAKRQICQTDVYYGDVDGFATNQIAVSNAGEILAFGRSRVHIYSTESKAFTATVYDWEAAGGTPLNPEE